MITLFLSKRKFQMLSRDTAAFLPFGTQPPTDGRRQGLEIQRPTRFIRQTDWRVDSYFKDWSRNQKDT